VVDTGHDSEGGFGIEPRRVDFYPHVDQAYTSGISPKILDFYLRRSEAFSDFYAIFIRAQGFGRDFRGPIGAS
jgi:hypothetical protein